MCSAECMNDTNSPSPVIQNCLKSCAQNTERADSALQTELNSFQKRFERCAMDCNDSAQDLLAGSQHSPGLQAEVQTFAMGCVSKCVDTHVDLLQKIESRVSKQLKSLSE